MDKKKYYYLLLKIFNGKYSENRDFILETEVLISPIDIFCILKEYDETIDKIQITNSFIVDKKEIEYRIPINEGSGSILYE